MSSTGPAHQPLAPQRRSRWLRVRFWMLIGAFLGLAVLAATSIVAEVVTREDEAALLEYRVLDATDIGRARGLDAASQRELLTRIVARVHAVVQRTEPLPTVRAREPRNVLDAATGVCFDRARVIEKAARLAGFETRRVFLLYGGWRRALVANSPGHTLVEVRTSGGWVFAGTLTAVTGFARDGRVWAARDLRADIGDGAQQLRAEGWTEVLDTDFVPLCGLYSRHDGHYPPYTPMPDCAPRQMFAAWWNKPSD